MSQSSQQSDKEINDLSQSTELDVEEDNVFSQSNSVLSQNNDSNREKKYKSLFKSSVTEEEKQRISEKYQKSIVKIREAENTSDISKGVKILSEQLNELNELFMRGGAEDLMLLDSECMQTISDITLSMVKRVQTSFDNYDGMELADKLPEANQIEPKVRQWRARPQKQKRHLRKSIQLLTESLALRKELLSEDDRHIAETYYHLGLAFSFSNDCKNANNCFQSAIQVIEARIVNLRKKISESNDENNDSNASIEREITRLEMLLPEMRLKIEDSKDQMENARKALEDEKVKEDAIALKSHEVKEKPITDISHLIKRKRPNSDTETTPKKVCSNGHNLMNDDKSSDQTNTST